MMMWLYAYISCSFNISYTHAAACDEFEVSSFSSSIVNKFSSSFTIHSLISVAL